MPRERVLIAAHAGVDDTALVTLVRAVADGGGWPTIMLGSVGEGDETDALHRQLADAGGQAGTFTTDAVADGMPVVAQQIEADSIVLFGVDEGVKTQAALTAASLDIPLWQPVAGHSAPGMREVGGVRFGQVEVPRTDDQIRPSRTWSFWLSAAAAALLALVVGVAGTFSYLSMPPVGLIVSALAVAGVLVGARASVAYRTPSVVAAVTLLVTVMLLSADPFGSGAAQGSVLVPASPLGWAWIGIVALGTFATLALPDFRAIRRTRMEAREGAAS